MTLWAAATSSAAEAGVARQISNARIRTRARIRMLADSIGLLCCNPSKVIPGWTHPQMFVGFSGRNDLPRGSSSRWRTGRLFGQEFQQHRQRLGRVLLEHPVLAAFQDCLPNAQHSCRLELTEQDASRRSLAADGKRRQIPQRGLVGLHAETFVPLERFIILETGPKPSDAFQRCHAK